MSAISKIIISFIWDHLNTHYPYVLGSSVKERERARKHKTDRTKHILSEKKITSRWGGRDDIITIRGKPTQNPGQQ